MKIRSIGVFFVAAIFTIAQPFALQQASAQTDDEVQESIEKLKRYLYRNYDRKAGNWESLYEHANGGKGAMTSMVVLALMLSGESAQKAELASAIRYLKNTKNAMTYGVSLRSHVWGQLSNEYLPELRKESNWLQKWGADRNGQFDYGARPLDPDAPDAPIQRHDHSCSHYGALGLWEASKRGVTVSPSFWRAAKNHWMSVQKSDGGWSYSDRPGDAPYGSMTAAGTTVLLIAQQELNRRSILPDPEITRAINRGIGWIDTRFTGYRNPLRDGQTGYYLYAIERVALASGRRHFNKEDWFRVGVRYFMGVQRDDGSIGNSPVDTCFGLMFMARGHVPVWASKIKVTGKRWNNRPNDMYFLTDYLSEHFEDEVNWQVLDINAPLSQWLSAPVAYMSSDQKLELDAKQKAAIKQYIDMGGLVVFSPDNGSQPFIESVRALSKELYPEFAMKPIPVEHPAFNLLYVMGDAAGQKIEGVNNGSRDLMLLATRDWGYTWQVERRGIMPGAGAAPSNTFKIATNLFAYATDRGRLSNRLVPKYESRVTRKSAGSLKIGRAKYAGNWNPEPVAWNQLSNHVFNFTGLEMDLTEQIDLNRIGSSRLPMVYMAGTQTFELTPTHKSAIRRYVRRGGTLFVETVGGRSNFARLIEKQLEPVFQSAARLVPDDDPLLTAKGLIGGYSIRKAEYRPWAVVNLKAGRKPKLAAFYLYGRPAVIISNEDLSMGALGVRHWGIGGYSPQTSKRLLTNVVLWAHKQSKD